jgi:hypothetical protein
MIPSRTRSLASLGARRIPSRSSAVDESMSCRTSAWSIEPASAVVGLPGASRPAFSNASSMFLAASAKG